jgi:hypothetical protein
VEPSLWRRGQKYHQWQDRCPFRCASSILQQWDTINLGSIFSSNPSWWHAGNRSLPSGNLQGGRRGLQTPSGRFRGGDRAARSHPGYISLASHRYTATGHAATFSHSSGRLPEIKTMGTGSPGTQTPAAGNSDRHTYKATMMFPPSPHPPSTPSLVSSSLHFRDSVPTLTHPTLFFQRCVSSPPLRQCPAYHAL